MALDLRHQGGELCVVSLPEGRREERARVFANNMGINLENFK